jgi:MFS family permease
MGTPAKLWSYCLKQWRLTFWIDALKVTGALGSSYHVGNRSVLLLCFSAVVAYSMSTNAYAPILSLIKSDLRLTYTEVGVVGSAYFIGYAIGQIPWGILVDRYGGKRVLAASVFGAGASTSVFALTGTGEMASLLRLISGLSAAGVFVPSVRVVSSCFPASRRGAALATLAVGGSLSVIVLGFASPYAADHLGWRLAFQIFAGVSAIDAVVLWLFLKDTPRKTTGGSHFRGSSFARRIVFDGGFWILGYAQFVRYGVQNLVLTWVSLFLVEAFGLPLWAAGAALSAMFAVTMLSDPVGGVISDRVGRIWVVWVSLVGLSGFITALALNKNEIVLWVLLTGIGWLVAFYRGTIFALVPERYGVEKTGFVSGAHNTFAAIGAFAVPLLFGYMQQDYF